MGRKAEPVETRFLRFVDRRNEDECWPWLGAKSSKGYGSFRVGNQVRSAHRVAYELFVGPVTPELQVDHVAAAGCTRKDCVNWLRHLEPVTPLENVQRFAGEECPRGHGREVGKDASGRCAECNRENSRQYYHAIR